MPDDGSGAIVVTKDQIGSALPTWVKSLEPYRTVLKSIGAAVQDAGSFRQAVLGFVVTWIVGGLLGVGETIVGTILWAFQPLLDALGITRTSLLGVFQPAGAAILGTWRFVLDAIEATTGLAGPAAPIVGTALVVAIGYLTYRLLISVSGEVPVLSTVVDFLGLRP